MLVNISDYNFQAIHINHFLSKQSKHTLLPSNLIRFAKTIFAVDDR